MRRTLANIGLALASTALCLGVLEGGARWLESGRPAPPGDERLALWEKTWGSDYYLVRSDSPGWPHARPINRDGLPDRSHPLEKPPGAWRVVCLGDSTTAGPSFRPRESYPALLQALADERGPRVEVMTVALWGWSTRQERRAFTELARRYQPDQVVLAICLNDIEELQNNLSRPPAWLGLLHRRSALVRRVVDAEGRQIRSIEELMGDTPRVEAGFALLFDELRALRREVAAASARLDVMVLPVQFQVRPGATPPRAQQRILDFCVKEGLRCVDLLPALTPVGDAAFTDLAHFTHEGHARVAAEALRLLPAERLGTPALAAAEVDTESATALTKAIAGADADVRAEAAWALGRLGEGAGAAVIARLATLLADPQERVRLAAARALGRIGPAAQAAVQALLERLADPRAPVRWSALDAVDAIGPGDEDVPRLASALSHPDPYIRAGAAWILGQMGPRAAPSARGALEAAQADADTGVRGLVLQALARVAGREEATAALVAALRDGGDGDYRWKAARALGRLGPQAMPARDALLAALADPNGHVRRESARALGRLGDASVAAALERALADAEPSVRREAATALGRLGAGAAALARAAQDPDDEVRAAAQDALGKTGR